MEASDFAVEKNFDFEIMQSYTDLNLKPFIYKSVPQSEIPILHKHALPVLLSLKNTLIFSPPATGKSSLLSIALHQLINLKYKGLQFLIVEQMDHLVKETYQSLLRFSFESNIKYCVCDNTTKVKQDFRPFADCQVAILNIRKCKNLLNLSRRSYDSVRFVVMDAFDPSYEKCLKVARLIKTKIPNAVFWVLGKPTETILQTEQFFMNYMVSPYLIKVVKHHVDIRRVSYNYTAVQNTQEKLYYLKKILGMNKDCQKVVFFNRPDPREILTEIKTYNPVLLDDRLDNKAETIQEFEKNFFKVLVVQGKQYFARRIKNRGSLYVVVFDLVSNDVLEVLVRRSGCSTNDRMFIFVQGNDEIEKVNEISEFFNVRVDVWPSSNDN